MKAKPPKNALGNGVVTMKTKSLIDFGYPNYTIYEDGTVIGPRKILSVFKSGNKEYPTVRLCHKGQGKGIFLHVLLAWAFIPNPNNLPEVNHKDGNVWNWDLNNLEWVTHKDNIRHAARTGLQQNLKGEGHPCAILTQLQVDTIRKRGKLESAKQIAQDYPVSLSMIQKILNHRNWELNDM